MQAGLSYFSKDTPKFAAKSLFDKYDASKTGYLEENELKVLLCNDLGLSEEQADIYNLILDKDGDQRVSFDEFYSWLRSGERFRNIQDRSRFYLLCKAAEQYKQFDVDNSGVLQIDQFEKLMTSMGYGKVDMEKFFASVDIHGNGSVSFWELMQWLNWVPI